MLCVDFPQFQNSKEGKSDIHEATSEHRQKTAEIYRQLQGLLEHWSVTKCTDGKDRQRIPEQMRADILTVLKF